MNLKLDIAVFVIITLLLAPSKAPAVELGESIGDSRFLDAFEKEVESEEFLRLTKDRLVEIISDDSLYAPEDKIYEAVMSWIRYKDSSDGDRTFHLPTLMQHVRLPLLRPNYLMELSEDPLIKACKKCLEYVEETKNYSYYLLMRHLGERADDKSSLNARFKPRRTDYLFAVGGNIDSKNPATSNVERYDPRKDQWVEVASMKSRRGGVGVVELGNILYAAGGFNGSSTLNSIERYNPHTGKWTDDVRRLEVPLSTSACVVTSNGILYVLCAYSSRYSSRSVWKYDSDTRSWISRRPFREARERYAVGVLDGYIYVLGGKVNDQAVDTVERYDPKLNEWHGVSPMLRKRKKHATAAHGCYLYAVGGNRDDWLPVNSAERYNSDKNRWELISPMTEHRYALGLAVANGLIYAVGGIGLDNISLNTVEVYDPSTNTWSKRAPMLKGRDYFGLAAMKYLHFHSL